MEIKERASGQNLVCSLALGKAVFLGCRGRGAVRAWAWNFDGGSGFRRAGCALEDIVGSQF